MTTRSGFRALFWSAASAAALFVFPVTARADSDGDVLVVRSGTAMEQWRQKTTAELNRLLMVEPAYSTTENAIVQISFTLGEDGMAANPQFYNRDGSQSERMAAQRAIERLANLAEVPVTSSDQPRFLANIIFASDARTLARLQRRLEKMETVRLASENPRDRYIALGY